MKKVLSILIILMVGVLLIIPNIKEREIELETESIQNNITNEPQISIFLKGDSGETTSDTIPEGYELVKDESYCYTTDKNQKTYNLVDYDLTFQTLKLKATISKNTKCILYFEVAKPASEKQLIN